MLLLCLFFLPAWLYGGMNLEKEVLLEYEKCFFVSYLEEEGGSGLGNSM